MNPLRFLSRANSLEVAPTFWLAQAVAIILAGATAWAQDPLEQAVFTVGTTHRDPQGQDWAYLAWHGATGVPQECMYSIYAKPGNADSPQSYERKAVIGLQTDPLVLNALISRATSLGHTAASLQESLDGMLTQLPPIAALTLADKLSAAIRGGLLDSDHLQQLRFLGRLHPAVAMGLGLAHAERISGPSGTRTTFEIRRFDMAQGVDLAVVGRVTVIAGQPLVLPAPERPVEVPDTSPKGDLNVKLRWATPESLRRVSLASHGFNVWRMTAAFAQANGFHLAPPTPAQLAQYAAQRPSSVQRLNHTPVLPERTLDSAEAANLGADPATYFFSDANERFDTNSPLATVPFENGSRFYYFAAARDVLGRDGLVSPGLLVVVCDRMPPPPPSRLRIENYYAYDPDLPPPVKQHLRITWRQNENVAPETTTAYFVYRWSSIAEMHALAGNPLAHRIAGPIAHIPGQQENSYLDNKPGAPEVAADHGKTFWYTVRAEDAGACGGNLSGNSPPAWGVLRERTGPEGGGGGVRIRCVTPEVVYLLTNKIETAGEPLVGQERFLLECRGVHDIRWAEFSWRPGGAGSFQFLARRYFAPGDGTVNFEASLPAAALPAGVRPEFRCRVGAANGKVSNDASSGLVNRPTKETQRARVVFSAHLKVQTVEVTHASSATPNPSEEPCHTHDPFTPDDGGSPDGQIHPLILHFIPPADAEEWRLYRRVNHGPHTLVSQGSGEFNGATEVSAIDDGLPAHASEVCYFVQFLDRHGNPGPMLPLGCTETSGATPLPTPVLKPITAEGTEASPKMRLQWFCPPAGVERFEVWVGSTPLAPPHDFSPDLIAGDDADAGLIQDDAFGPEALVWRRYRTSRIGPALGEGPSFSVLANSAIGNRFRVYVKAVGPDDTAGPASNVEKFSWQVPTATNPNVPWPARGLPSVNQENFPGVMARVLQIPGFEGLGVRVGAATYQLVTANPPAALANFIPTTGNPLNSIYRSPADELLFDVALYRQQVPNNLFPQVSGDVLQVSPLMETIAYTVTNAAPFGIGILIVDPFIRVVPEGPLPSPDHGIYLLDTQPVVQGARYRYVLLRFSKRTHEPVEAIPTNEIDVPAL